jgi:N-acyl-L-homoserine lactone synthetase
MLVEPLSHSHARWLGAARRERQQGRSPAFAPVVRRGRALQPAVHYQARPLRRHEAVTLDTAFQLRHVVFARELGWVPARPDGRERDRCDAAARHFGVFSSATAATESAPSAAPTLVGYARVLLPEHVLMLQREFAALLAGHPLDVDARRTFEVSRFMVHPRYRGRLGADRRGVVEHLARAVVRWAARHGRTEWLSVCEVRHVRALRMRGLPFTRFGQVVEYQPGVYACATRLALPQAADQLRALRPHDYAWYTEGITPPWSNV